MAFTSFRCECKCGCNTMTDFEWCPNCAKGKHLFGSGMEGQRPEGFKARGIREKLRGRKLI